MAFGRHPEKPRHKDPDYIDIFAEDDDGSPVVSVSLFDDDEDASNRPAKKSAKKKQKGAAPKPKAPAPRIKAERSAVYTPETQEEKAAVQEAVPDADESRVQSFLHAHFTFPERDENEDKLPPVHEAAPSEEEDGNEYGIEQDFGGEDTEDEAWEDEEDTDEAAPEDGGTGSGTEEDEDEEEDDAESAPVNGKKRRFSLFKKKNRSEESPAAEKQEAEAAPAEEAASPSEPPLPPPLPVKNSDDDWDIGGDFADPFFDEKLNPPENEEAPEAEEDEGSSIPEDPFITFDWTGSRTGKRKTNYGRRKNAKKASTVIVTNDTEPAREEEEARIRAEKRDYIRDREIKKRREAQKAQFLRNLRQRLTVMGLLGILLVIAIIASFFVFRVTGISVNGTCTRYDAETIIEKSGLVKGRHILLQDLSGAQEALNADPYLEATVKYIFPNKVNVTIQERKGIGAVQWGPDNEYIALVDAEGYVLDARLNAQGNIPLVKGLVLTRVLAGSKIGDDADEQVQSTLDVLSALDAHGLLAKIRTVDITETMGISLYTAENYRIELGSVSDLETKLNRLSGGWTTIMQQANSFKSKNGVDNITIYLYSKYGVTVSPHDVGYVDENNIPVSTVAEPTPAPVTYSDTTYTDTVPVTPEPTPEPADVIPSFDNLPFTG